MVNGSSSDEIALFLARYAPFRDLGAAHLHEIAAHARLQAYLIDTPILRQSADPSPGLFIVRHGTVELLDEGVPVERLGEGEVFGFSVLSGIGPSLSAVARAGSSCYMVDAERARQLLGTAPGLSFLSWCMARWRERDSAEHHVRRAGMDDALADEIGRAGDVDALVSTSHMIPSLVGTLLERGVDPIDIGHVVGVTVDQLTTRLIEFYVEQAGEPPASFAWVALGSAARHEQALTTDQDHAISYGGADDIEAIDPYFARLATFVTDGLEACGITRCRGNVMAENPAWRRTVDGWRRRFMEYMTDPDIMGTRITNIAFDYRRVTGPVDIEPALDEVIRDARNDLSYVRRLVATVLESRPPVGRFRDVVVPRGGEHPGRVDIKHGGITPITNLARLSAIRAGVTENRTLERLRGAAAAGLISEGLRLALTESFRLLWRVRLEHHVAQLEQGTSPDDFVDPASLTPISRRAIGVAFHTIASAQTSVAKID
jgi:signal-transduction protein with cAMP-binding, CBS, and nucleotidyltransferase domain